MAKIHIEIIGQGPPLILIHGWGWHSGIWEPLIPDLKTKFQLFLVDLPGFGKSPLLTTNYELETLSNLLLPHIPLNATWLGWSLGGIFAWWHAIHRPERVAKLITVASSPKFTADHQWPGVLPSTLDKFSQSLSESYEKTLTEFLELQLRGSSKQNNLFSILQQQLQNTPKTALPALLGGLKLLKETDLRADLAKITCPSLHIFGQFDVLVPTRIIPFITEHMPYSRCEIIKKTGHIPFLTHPEIFCSLIKLSLDASV